MIDPELEEGDPFWREMIARRFQECELMVGLVSVDALNSPWVEQEQRAFPGSTLWIAVDPRRNLSPLAGVAPDRLVPRDRALAKIRNALPAAQFRPCGKRRAEQPRLSRSDERLGRMRKQQAELEAFLRSLQRFTMPGVEAAGDIARIADGFMELRRIGSWDGPARRATYIGAMPVTNGQYRAFLEATGYPEPPSWERAEFRADDAPVTSVNWFEARAYAAWVGGSLPTEAEWVQAARGGEQARRFATATGEIGPELACLGRAFGGCAPVAAKAYRPNPEDYYGLCGNTWDWCDSRWGSHRVIRGGGCMDSATFCAVQARYRNAPIDRDCCVGFRVKIELDTNYR